REKCWGHSDCGNRECCAGMSWKNPGACAYQPQREQKCFPWIFPSSKVHCPCVLGTSCTDYYDPQTSKTKYKCMKYVSEIDEVNGPQ
ncbi:hypothetical protein QZH41_015414, partial [Actinostola sp. cb2023]